VVLKSSESFQIVSSFIFFVFLFTSSIFYPAIQAPAAIKTVSLLNPLTYTTDLFRAGLFNSSTPLISLELIALAIEAAAIFTVAVLAFRRIRVVGYWKAKLHMIMIIQLVFCDNGKGLALALPHPVFLLR
jgi:ABC-type multidrug transport system permease subunit